MLIKHMRKSGGQREREYSHVEAEISSLHAWKLKQNIKSSNSYNESTRHEENYMVLTLDMINSLFIHQRFL